MKLLTFYFYHSGKCLCQVKNLPPYFFNDDVIIIFTDNKKCVPVVKESSLKNNNMKGTYVLHTKYSVPRSQQISVLLNMHMLMSVY